jgi:putative addiction module component (TIGR02574 family)
MITAQNKIQLAKKLLETEDKQILKAVNSILNPEEETIDLTPAQKKDLDKRLADHKAGKLKYYTISDVKKAVLQAIKK